jgi:hypothetical protein
MTNNKTYDALIIPTGETTFGDYKFPVTNEAIKLFNSGKYGCIFITGGYGGFATKERLEEKTKDGGRNSEGRETYDYILGRGIKGINSDKVYYDDQSLESVGNFTFPIIEQVPWNPNLLDFKNMEIIAKEGHMWRLEDYARIVMPDKYYKFKIDFHKIAGEHNNGLMAKVYHRGIMNALKGKKSPEEIHKSLMNNHPFYLSGWYDKPVLERKALMAAVGGLWNIGFDARLK